MQKRHLFIITKNPSKVGTDRMNTLQFGVITLIRSALTQQAYPLPEDFHIEDAAAVIHRHHIAPLCYAGAALCGIPTDTPFMMKLFNLYCSATIKTAQQDRAITKLLHAFEETGIDYIPLKGTRMRPLYPKPELRLMGDADILIRKEQYESIVPIVKGQGFKTYAETTYDYSFESPDLFLELHHRLLSPEETAYTAVYADGWHMASPLSGHRWEMSLEDEWLYMFGHFTKHYASGIGIRHVVDLWMFLRAYPDLDKTYVNKQLSKLKFGKFYNNVLALIDLWFEGGQATEITDYMTNYVFSNGSWGTDETHVMSELSHDAAKNIPLPVQFLKRVWLFVFPPRARLEKTFPVLKNHGWLYPFLALIRPFVRLFSDRGAVKLWIRLAGDYSGEKVDEKRRQLEYVGFKIRR